MKHFLYLSLILLVLSGCTTPVFLYRTNPPEMVLPEKPATIVFANQYDYWSNPAIKDKHDVAYQTAIRDFGRALSVKPKEVEPAVIFVADTPSDIFAKDSSRIQVLDSIRMLSILKPFSADYLLTLDSLSLFFDWEVFREENPEDGSVSKTKNFYLIGRYFVTLYNPDGVVVKQTLLDRSMLYSARPTLGALITILPNMSNGLEKIQVLSRDAAAEYTTMFYPVREQTGYRQLHAGKAFKESNEHIIAGRYGEAIPLLEAIASGPKTGLARKARENLKVIAELQGNSGW
ncbi:hypothetical protein BA6E_12124 [Bacteroidales bacterium 6E]|nr:hypothetical protein BA6E_12124 [Bacteroidales bacterium 6E]